MIISMKNNNESFSEKLLMERVTQVKRLWSMNIQRESKFFFFLELADFKTHGVLHSNNAWVLSVCGAYYTRARSLFAVKFALSAPLPLTRTGQKREKRTGCYGKWRDGHQACGLLVGFDLLDLLGGGMCHWKEDGILTSTLNTFRKKLLCRCLVLVFTTVRFQSAMLGKCFSLS